MNTAGNPRDVRDPAEAAPPSQRCTNNNAVTPPAGPRHRTMTQQQRDRWFEGQFAQWVEGVKIAPSTEGSVNG